MLARELEQAAQPILLTRRHLHLVLSPRRDPVLSIRLTTEESQICIPKSILGSSNSHNLESPVNNPFTSPGGGGETGGHRRLGRMSLRRSDGGPDSPQICTAIDRLP
mgnify:CR=1 FL=1